MTLRLFAKLVALLIVWSAITLISVSSDLFVICDFYDAYMATFTLIIALLATVTVWCGQELLDRARGTQTVNHQTTAGRAEMKPLSKKAVLGLILAPVVTVIAVLSILPIYKYSVFDFDDDGSANVPPKALVFSPTISASGEKVAFGLSLGNDDDPMALQMRLKVMSLPSANVQDTGAEVSARLFSIAWHPDESIVVFISSSSTNYLGLESIDTQNFRTTKISGASCWSPRYSRNGKYLGYVRNDNLIVRNVDSGAERTVAEHINHWYWCWDSDGESVFYIQDGHIFRQGLRNAARQLVVYSKGRDVYEREIGHLVLSPDGSTLGFRRNNVFHVVDLDTLAVSELFECDHYFLCFDWTHSGIVYLDQYKGDREDQARLVVFDPNRKTADEIATGRFRIARWVDPSNILVRVGNAELWLYNVDTGQRNCIFSCESQSEQQS